MPLTTGQILNGRYRIVKLIGQGGFGAVYRAWDLNLKQPVALKENLDASHDAQRQFEREATLMAGLRHPNLPRVIDHFFVPGQGQYLIMDFIEGQNLEELLRRHGRPFSETEVLPWVKQVCDALSYLHSRTPPVIHRDVKPKNIIIMPDGRVMLVDFGISKLYDPVIATTMGARAVTPGYSPPEQYGRGNTDARADVYALGATLYMLLTAQDPPESVELVADSTLLTPPRQLNPGLSPTMEQVMLKAMATSSTKRFASANELYAALVGSAPGAATRTPAASPTGGKRNARYAWLLLPALLLLVVGGLWLRGREREATPIFTAITPEAAGVGVESGDGDVAVALPSATPTMTATPTPTAVVTSTAVATSSATPTSPATATLAATATRASAQTATQTPTAVRTAVGTAVRTAVATATTTAAPANPVGQPSAGGGLPLGFESFGVWSRGNEPNGTFTQSSTQAHSGGVSAKLSYEFNTSDNDYVVFMQSNAIQGTPNALQLWVYGDGSGHYLNAWIIDSEGQTWQVPFGQVFHSGWRQLTGYIAVGQPWPWTHISGPDNQQVDYPIAFRAFVFDDYSPGYTGQGTIYLDDLTATTLSGAPVGVTPIVPTLTPGGTPAPGTPTATAAPVNPGAVGRILYTSGNILLTTDPDWNAPLEVGTAASDTCSSPATTITGATYNLYLGNYCGVGSSGTGVCASPNGVYEVVTNAVEGGHSLVVRLTGAATHNFVYQGQLDTAEGIRWSPLSDSFLFVVGDSVNRAFPDGSYNQVIPTAYRPIFSPDGSLILYLKPIGPGVNDVFVSNSDGSNARNVTNVATIDKRCPAWRN